MSDIVIENTEGFGYFPANTTEEDWVEVVDIDLDGPAQGAVVLHITEPCTLYITCSEWGVVYKKKNSKGNENETI